MIQIERKIPDHPSLRWIIYLYILILLILTSCSISNNRRFPTLESKAVITLPTPTPIEGANPNTVNLLRTPCWNEVWPRVSSDTAISKLAGSKPFKGIEKCGNSICWMSIRPGETTFERAGEILKEKGVKLVSSKGDSFYKWSLNACEPPKAEVGLVENYIFNGMDGFVDSAKIWSTPITFQQVIEQFGQPTRYVIYKNNNPDKLQFAVGLVFDNYDVIFRTPYEDLGSNEFGDFKPDRNMVIFRFFLIRSGTTKNMKSDDLQSFYPWQGLR